MPSILIRMGRFELPRLFKALRPKRSPVPSYGLHPVKVLDGGFEPPSPRKDHPLFGGLCLLSINLEQRRLP